MKQVLIRQGRAVTVDVPAPVVEPGTVLVRVERSCISVGTEMSGLRASGRPLWQRAIRQPGKVRQVIESVTTQGFATTKARVEGKLASGEPTGYSAAGTVLEVGAGVTDMAPGDRVACAGAQAAHHAELIRVPRNLVVSIPENLGFTEASTVTLGAIALQGVRRAQPTIGESFVVVGLGILGQLTAQLLRANGCRVIGTDLDPSRVSQAVDLGMDVGLDLGGGSDVEQVGRLTDGIGADGVIITAASSSDAVISTAFRMCRKKGRVVLVGDVGLDLDRADFYQKELDFFISSSYGPGRYDRNYEERGLDYPVGYVRWTENRNMGEYLRLVADGRVNVMPLVGVSYPIEEASRAYEALDSTGPRPLAVLLAYPPADPTRPPVRVVANPRARAGRSGPIRVALVGAGGFAKGMHLPNMQALSADYQLHAVVSRTGHNATTTAAQFGARYATTELGHVLDDPEVDLVLIATRHDLHAAMVLEALGRGKHVLVEKPLALTRHELERVLAFYESQPEAASPPVLMTGFNRRFSAYARRIVELTQGRANPMILDYRMNAGYVPLDNWVHTDEGGGRNRGEACHVYDLFTFLTGSRVTDVHARAIRPATRYYSASDNFVATVAFDDGSLATLTYTALGSKEHSKEQLEVFVDGAVIVLDDYRKLTVNGSPARGITTSVAAKGQKEELQALARTLRNGGEWPIPLWHQAQATEIALRVEPLIAGGS
jgi:predicted dehydrogenase/threonine dehydrogenase-like Zn-dependent dehydrogenase